MYFQNDEAILRQKKKEASEKLQLIRQTMNISEEELQELKKAFEFFDADGSTELDVREL